MKSRIRPRKPLRVVFDTWFPLQIENEIFDRYCTYGKRFTRKYLHCLIFGHSRISSSSIIEDSGVVSTYYADCCERRYYPKVDHISEAEGV